MSKALRFDRHRRTMAVWVGTLATAIIAILFGLLNSSRGPAIVLAARETEPLTTDGDAADDPCIWIHPSIASQSLVIVTDKRRGLVVYNLDGKQIQELPGGEPNNIDNRGGVAFGREFMDVFVAGDRKSNALAFWSINPATRQHYLLGQIQLEREAKVYGSCFYRSRKRGDCHVFVTVKHFTFSDDDFDFVLSTAEVLGNPRIWRRPNSDREESQALGTAH
jgi:myo-inositol-hexaphosphate 3-phosphohydrolase